MSWLKFLIGIVSQPFGIPDKLDALFWLDGTLNESGTALVDKINGWEFPLSAAYDWKTNNKIIPYRTALTISAPANGTAAATAIKAKDFNNFWYNAAGNPNAIRPIFFSNGNVDFENKCFVKRKTRKVNLFTGVELKACGITDIVLYKTVKTSVNLPTYNSYFGCEIEDPNALWVTKTGNNANPGTKALPFLSITTGCAGANRKVYVKTGMYNEGASLNLPYPVKLYAIGAVSIYNTAATQVVAITSTASNAVYEFRGLIMGAVFPSNTIISDTSGLTNLSISIKNCFLTQYRDSAYISAANGCNAVIEDNVLISNRVVDLTGRTFSTANYTTNVISRFRGNYVNDNAYKGFEGNFSEFKYNKVVHSAVAKNIAWGIKIENIAVNIGYNEWISSLTQYSVTRNLIYIKGAASVLIAYEKIYINSEYATSGIVVEGSDSGSITNGCHIHHIYQANKSRNIYGIRIGTDQTAGIADNTIRNIILEKNTVLGSQYFDVSKGGTHHLLMIGFQKNPIVRHNFTSGGKILMLIKGKPDTAWTSGGLYANVAANTPGQCLFIKGVSGVKAYNNVFFNSYDNVDVPDSMLVRLGGLDEEPSLPNNCDIRNNIIVDRGATANVTELINITHQDITGTIINKNILYSANGYYGAWAGHAVGLNFASWQALGFDTESRNENIEFNDAPNFKFWPTNAQLGGADLGEEFDEILSILSDFGLTTSEVSIVTTEQNEQKQIGAYKQ